MPTVPFLGSYGDISGSGLMFRNKLINGGFTCWQRGTSVTQAQDVGTIGSYAADRWRVGGVRDGVAWRQTTFARELTVVPDNSFAAAKLTLGASDINRVVLMQRIEATNCSEFKTCGGVFSFRLRRIATVDASTSLRVVINSANSLDNFSAVTNRVNTVLTSSVSTLSNSAYTDFSLPFAANAAYGNGMEVQIELFTSGVSIPLAGIGDFFYFANFQVETGTVPTPFEFRNNGLELALCQRYYAVAQGTGQAPSVIGTATSTGTVACYAKYPITMRTPPQVTLYSYLSTANKISRFADAADVGTNVIINSSQNGPSQFISIGDTATPFVAGVVYWFWYTASAEL